MSDMYEPLGGEGKTGGHDERQDAPSGFHSFIIYNAELVTSQQSGLPMYKYQLRLTTQNGETPWKDVFGYIPLPHPKRLEIAKEQGKNSNPNIFLKQQAEGFFQSIEWNTAPVAEGGRGKPSTEMEVRGLINMTGRTKFVMGKARGEYPARLEARFADTPKQWVVQHSPTAPGPVAAPAPQPTAAPTPPPVVEPDPF